MNRRIVGALIAKDLTLFFRSRFFALMSVLGIVAYATIYFLMPSTVNEELEIGLHTPMVPPVYEQMLAGGQEGLALELVESEDALETAVLEGTYIAGISLPADYSQKLAAGQSPLVRVFFPSDSPDELKEAVTILVREAAFLESGQLLIVEITADVLGVDRAGAQIPPRDRLLPLMAVLILMMETLGLASLISEEVEGHTIQALLVTPMNVRGLFLAKGAVGTTLAFGQALLFLAVVGGFSEQPLIVIVTLLLGALLVTGIGFLMASLAKSLMSVFAWGMVAIVVLSVPAFGILFPGTISGWIQAIPSYYLVDTVHLAANFGFGWEDIWDNLLILLGFDVVIFGLGVWALRRKMR
jgi:hypothetical protein